MASKIECYEGTVGIATFDYRGMERSRGEVGVKVEKSQK